MLKHPAAMEGADRTPARQAGSAMPPLMLRAKDAAALCAVSIRTWRGWDAANKIPRAVRIGRSIFWRTEELRVWSAAGCPCRHEWESLQS
jgi:predicted DNA-binding transcriptional regulator AlpA